MTALEREVVVRAQGISCNSSVEPRNFVLCIRCAENCDHQLLLILFYLRQSFDFSGPYYFHLVSFISCHT